MDYLIDRWREFVTKLENHNPSSVVEDEYRNGVDSRQIIAESLPILSNEERLRYEKVIPAIDQKFCSATKASDKCIWGEEASLRHGYAPDIHWWYFRVPANSQ